jgi:hypothetical protein
MKLALYSTVKDWIKGTREKKTSYGNDNAGKKFYVIGFNRGQDGLFYIITTTLLHIEYALEHGYIPVVDLQNYNNQFHEAGAQGRENAWEYFFLQPMDYTLDDIAKSRNIIQSRKDATPFPDTDRRTWGTSLLENRERLNYFKELFQNYVRFNETTREYLEKDYNKILQGRGRVLGVLCRGTDYLAKRPPGHQIQPDPHEVLLEAEKIMAARNCSYLYLGTEDQAIYEMFQDKFKQKLLTNSQKRFSSDDFIKAEWLSEVHFNRERDKYNLGLEYLSTINLLSKCVCFIGGTIGGTVGVYMMTAGFEYDYVWKLGRYPPPHSN